MCIRDSLEAMPPWQGGGDMISSVTFEKTEWNVLPWKFEANKGLNVLYDGKPTSPRNPIIAAFGLWLVFLIMTEIFFRV